MQQTPNLGLRKPEGSDVVDIDDLNYNADVLDVEVTKLATASQAGRMSAADKAKLDGIAAGAEVNQNAFSNVKVGATTIAADSKTDTLELAAGSGISLTPDATNDKVTIGVAFDDTVHGNRSGGNLHATATQTTAGFMSAADKTRLDGATSTATPNTIVQRDSAGRFKAAAPAAADDIARKDTVDAVQTNLNNHIADYARHPGYGVTGGSGNAYTVMLSPAPSAYTDGMGIVIKANRDNTGASTLNINGIGARPIKKPNGNDVAAGNIKNGGIYTLRYNATTGNFILQGEGGDFNVGDTITDVRLLTLNGGMGAEVWSKTDVTNAWATAVDSSGYVYCTHDVGSGNKAIRKLDSSGNEVWSKTDVAYGRGIAVDSSGYVYCAHSAGSGNKAIRKLDGNRYFKII